MNPGLWVLWVLLAGLLPLDGTDPTHMVWEQDSF